MISVIENIDCIEGMKKLPDNSIDSIISDPPYGLKFMGKKWDYSVPSVQVWQAALRVLKPGGHLLSFGGARTYHRMVVNIEDAGFEIRDQLQWIYGSGFPKSLDVSKAIDRLAGAARESDEGTHSGGDTLFGKIGGAAMRFGDSGGASRFFYVAKASKSERGSHNSHPTVKPLELMQYLIKLITPPDGIFLDPFCGSGSTLIAGALLGFKYIGFDNDLASINIARKRLKNELGMFA